MELSYLSKITQLVTGGAGIPSQVCQVPCSAFSYLHSILRQLGCDMVPLPPVRKKMEVNHLYPAYPAYLSDYMGNKVESQTGKCIGKGVQR